MNFVFECSTKERFIIVEGNHKSKNISKHLSKFSKNHDKIIYHVVIL